MQFKDSKRAHELLDSLKGIEIGGAEHNPFHLPDCINVDCTDDMNTVFKIGEEKLYGKKMKVDVVANGDDLPFPDNTWDYVISSHVIEHFFDPVKALKEWLRVVKPGGCVFIICPHSYRVATETRPITRLKEIVLRHEGLMLPEQVDMSRGHNKSAVSGLPLNEHGHWTIFDTGAFIAMCDYYQLPILEYADTDDKVGNGFTVVLRKLE